MVKTYLKFLIIVILFLSKSSFTVEGSEINLEPVENLSELNNEELGLTSIRVDGIMYESNAESVAIINGKMSKKGDSIDGYEILTIEKEYVVLLNGEVKHRININSQAALKDVYSDSPEEDVEIDLNGIYSQREAEYYKKAISYGNKATAYFNQDEYDEAKKYAPKALEGFLRMDDTAKAKRMRQIIKKSRELSAKTKKAIKEADETKKEEIEEAIKKHKIVVGMTKAQVRKSVGSLTSASRGDLGSGVYETWYYDKAGVYLSVDFDEDGIVSSWHKSN